MAVISTSNLHDSFVQKFSIGSNSAARFTSAFIAAYNDALFDLYNDGHVGAPTLLTSLSPPTADNSGVADEFTPVAGEVYCRTDTLVYYVAVVTDGSAQLLSDTDYWSVVSNYDSAIEERYLPQIKMGIKFFLQSEGEWVKSEGRADYSYLNWERAKTVWLEVATASEEDSATRTYPWGD